MEYFKIPKPLTGAKPLPSSVNYMQAENIFYSKTRKKGPSEPKNYNFYAKFIFFKQPNFIVLKDDSTEKIQFHVRCLHPSIIEKFKLYFRPWFLFRFQQVLLASALSSFNNNPKTLNFNCSDPNSIVVFELIKEIDTRPRALFHVSQNPIITELDYRIVEGIQSSWCNKICDTSFRDFKRNLTLAKNAFINVTFMAQLIEIKQLSSRLILIKAWDGTTPDFDFINPIKQPTVQNDSKETGKPNFETLSDPNLDKLAGKKKVYIVAMGENVGKFYNRKPNDLVLIFNATLCSSNANQPFRIEITSSRFEQDTYVKNFEKNTNLGQLLMGKIEPIPKTIASNAALNFEKNTNLDQLPMWNHQPSTSMAIQPTSNQMEICSNPETMNTGDSFQQNQAMNQIIYLSDFSTNIEQLNNYEVICSIKDVYPLDYTVFDLINLKCTDCGLDESVKDLFDIDFDGLRNAAKFYLTQYGSDRKEILCISCGKPSAYFKYKIVFLLQDRIGGYLISLFGGVYAERFFAIKPLEVLADETKEFIFKNKFEELRKIFDYENGDPNRSMVILRDGQIYEIKAINFMRDV